MRIGVLGAGNIADGLGNQWVRAGHEVMVSGRDRAKAQALADRIGPGAHAGTWSEAAGFGDVVLVAVRHHAVTDVLDAAGAGAGALRGRVVIDCTNSFAPERFVPERAMAEHIAAAAPGAHVVKAFNLCHEDVWRMTPPVFGGRPLAVPMCGDDPDALATVSTLVRDLGCTPVDGGGLERAVLLEATAAFVVKLWFGGVDAQAILTPLEHSGSPS